MLMEKFYIKNRFKSILLSLLIVLTCYSLVYLFGSFVYLSNDDAGIQATLSGVTTGQPYPAHQFINIYLGQFISSLYTKYPFYQWWFISEHILLILGICMTNYYTLLISYKNKQNILIVFLLLLPLNVLFFAYSVDRVSFTIAPCIFATGLVCCAIASDRIGVIKLILLSLLNIVCALYRYQTALVSFAFLSLVFVYKSIERKKIIHLIFTVLIIVSSWFSMNHVNNYNRNYLTELNGDEFNTFNNARILYMDYPADSYYDNEKIYQDVNWDEYTYRMVINWCFMDENVTADSFEYLHNNSAKNTDTDKIISSRISNLKTLLSDKKSAYSIVVWLSLSVVVLISFLKNKTDVFSQIIVILTISLSIAMFAYLAYKGRVLYRAIIVFIIPSFFILSNVYLSKIKLNSKMVSILTIVFLMIISILLMKDIFTARNREIIEDMTRKEETLNGFAMINSEKKYIRDLAVVNNISPKTLYPNDKPTNVISYGGSTFYSDSWKKRLSLNNLKKLDYSVFYDVDVYYVTTFDVENESNKNNKNNSLYYMFHLIYKHDDEVSIRVVDRLFHNMIVYKFVFNFQPGTYVYNEKNGWEALPEIEEETNENEEIEFLE